MNKTQYFDVLRAKPELSKPDNFLVDKMCHSVSRPVRIKKILAPALSSTVESPRLLSKAKVGGPFKSPKPYEPDTDVDFVFCYLAPRIKAIKQDIQSMSILVFTEKGHSIPASCARPMDSGGLTKNAGPTGLNMDNLQIKALIEELTFKGPWISEFQLFGSRLFDSCSAYLQGSQPTGTDPLSLPSDDPYNFTWEVLCQDQLPFEGRLVGALEVIFVNTDETNMRNVNSLNSEQADLFFAKQKKGRIEYKTHSYDTSDHVSSMKALRQDFHDFYETCSGRPGW